MAGLGPWRTAGVAGHLALLNAWYGAACVVLVARWSGAPGWPAAGAFGALLAHSVYLLDRVKLCDAMRDAADSEAHPGRMSLLWPRRRGVRAWMWAAGLGSAVLGAGVWWPLALVVPCAWVGVILYAHRTPAWSRPKDRLIVKNLAVGASLGAMAGVAAWGGAGGGAPLARVATAAALLAVLVSGDAALCDIGDADTDGRYGTRTIPVVRGLAATLAAGWLCAVLACGGLVAVAVCRGQSAPIALITAGTILLTQPLLDLVAHRDHRLVRDAVDVRLGIVALAALIPG